MMGREGNLAESRVHVFWFDRAHTDEISAACQQLFRLRPQNLPLQTMTASSELIAATQAAEEYQSKAFSFAVRYMLRQANTLSR